MTYLLCYPSFAQVFFWKKEIYFIFTYSVSGKDSHVYLNLIFNLVSIRNIFYKYMMEAYQLNEHSCGSEEKGTLCTKIHPQNFPFSLFSLSFFLSLVHSSIPNPAPQSRSKPGVSLKSMGALQGRRRSWEMGAVMALHLAAFVKIFRIKIQTLCFESVSS